MNGSKKRDARPLSESIETINERATRSMRSVALNARMTHVERVIGFSAGWSGKSGGESVAALKGVRKAR